MAVTRAELRSGAYFDSVILMQLQQALSALPGVSDAGVVMATAANKAILEQTGLISEEAQLATSDDLLAVVKAIDEQAAMAALGSIDEILANRRSGIEQEYRPKSQDTALQVLPEARWSLISVPGRYASGVARKSLDLGLCVFLYSDNVSLDDEISLKKHAAEKGLLVMGPDCGTAIINGVGLGFANQVRRGPIGIVAASGTGLQQVGCRIHQLGSGVSHGLGTGGRDLSNEVGATTALQALDLLVRDEDTRVIVLVSKPPSSEVAERLLKAARSAGKPIVVDFIGFASPMDEIDNLHFCSTLDSTAELAVRLANADDSPAVPQSTEITPPFAPDQRYLRGLYSGGTLAHEALLLLSDYLPAVFSNIPLEKELRLRDSLVSHEHSVIDLGEDEFTVGRLHPMMDNELRIRRLLQEAEDPSVAVVVLDVVLGHGAHPDPAGELAPAIAEARDRATKRGRYLHTVAVLVGTDADPQDFDSQWEQLETAGASVVTNHAEAIRSVAQLLRSLHPDSTKFQPSMAVPLSTINTPMAAINVGLETFSESLATQGAQVVQVDWRPPAGGNERLAAILARMGGS